MWNVLGTTLSDWWMAGGKQTKQVCLFGFVFWNSAF